ncbi:MAG TPA: MsnO8 family LLM class oxidoreductase [Caulobacteraceae bacterium]|nr:MsnO8 family LLM class oxidoreductase [Caulobacteraceae bacterium]
MTPAFSVLDLSPVSAEGGTQAGGVRDTLEVARAAERLGYRRFWVAEHHSIEHLSSPAPEVLIAALTQATRSIRLGSGGVMLPNYSPLKVAEVFMELEALAPGRIDLGLGRALGADYATGRALGSASSEVFPQYFALLSAWLLDASGVEPFPAGHPFSSVKANPRGPSHPDLFLLCSSADSARFAGMAGVGMVFAEFIARADGAPAVAAYREAFQPSIWRREPCAGVATIALAADTAAEAERLAAMTPRRPGLPEAAERFIRRIRGDGAAVRAFLAEKLAATGADELFVMSGGPTLASRIRSLELIAEGMTAADSG